MAKREFYARAAVQLRTHERAIAAEAECPGAMGLFLFLLLQARGEQSAGDVAELVALTSWSAPSAYRRKQVSALVNAGLVEQVGDRLHVVRYADHNDTPEVIDANRQAARQRKEAERARKTVRESGIVTRDIAVTHTDVPISISLSDSPDLGSQISEQAPDQPPEWWAGTIGAAEMVAGTIDAPAELWPQYVAARERRKWSIGHRDALGWLLAVRRNERQRNTSRVANGGRPEQVRNLPHLRLEDIE